MALRDAEGSIFQPLTVRSLELRNRLVMSPMTREFSPDGVPGADVAEYYRRRAEGGAGLIITEGVGIDHPSSVDHPDVPRMFGRRALDGWARVVDAVHGEGGSIIPQLWHVGPLWGAMRGGPAEPMRPSGLWGTPGVTLYPPELVTRSVVPTRPMTADDMREVIDAYRMAARNAVAVGFDGIAIHGGHGYLLDSFLWADTNRREDEWGGTPQRRAAFPAAVVRAVREEVGDRLPIFFRFSQHKQQDFKAQIAHTPEELGQLLTPLVDAGVDVLDASGRRFTAPAFSGSDLTLAGWAKRLTGVPTMAVGRFGAGEASPEPVASASRDDRDALAARLAVGEFDLIGVGRQYLADAGLPARLAAGEPLESYDAAAHRAVLV